MKTTVVEFKKRSLLLLVTVLILCSSFISMVISPIKLGVESNHSTIQFTVPIANGITKVTGKFTEYEMDIDYDSINFTNSKISLIIRAESINTGILGRDEHLRTADFFDTETYPTITFMSSSITEGPNGTYVMEGDFSMHGITKKMEVPLTPTGKDGNYTLGFSSELSLSRTDFGVGDNFQHTSMDNFIGDEIAIEIYFWTKKWKEPQK